MERLYILNLKLQYGRARPEQLKFIEAMKQSGALAGFARSVEDAFKIVFPENY